MYELEEKSMEYTLHEVYRGKICDLQAQLRNKDSNRGIKIACHKEM